MSCTVRRLSTTAPARLGSAQLLQQRRSPGPFPQQPVRRVPGRSYRQGPDLFLCRLRGTARIRERNRGRAACPIRAVIAQAQANITSWGEPLNPVTAALLARNPWPTPNIRGRGQRRATAASANNLSISTRFNNRVDSLIGKIDHNFNASNLLTGRYYFGDSDQSFPFAQLRAGGLLPGFNTITPTRVQLVSLSYVKVVNANQLNEARLGLEPVCGRLLPRGPELRSFVDRLEYRGDLAVRLRTAEDRRGRAFRDLARANSVPAVACGFQLALH